MNGSKAKNIVDKRIKQYKHKTLSDHFMLAVLASSSQGNASIINNKIGIDHGLQSKDYSILKQNHDSYNPISLFITHSHFDHFRVDSIVRNIAMDNAFNRIYCTNDQKEQIMSLVNDIINDNINDDSKGRVPRSIKKLYNHHFFDDLFVELKPNKNYLIDNLLVTPIEIDHSIENFAFEISIINTDHKLLYATDLSNTSKLPNRLYELIAIENSWSKSFHIKEEYKESLSYHLDSLSATMYVLNHLVKDGEFEELHTSMYTTRINDVIKHSKTYLEAVKLNV